MTLCLHILLDCICMTKCLCAALVGGVALGFANPTLGCLADSYSLSKFSTFGIFIISGSIVFSVVVCSIVFNAPALNDCLYLMAQG